MTEQGSPEWLALRLGKVTASRISDMLAKTKTGWGASRANYRAQLVAERLTGIVAESYTNAAMDWGREKESEARSAYEWARNCDVELIDFVVHPSIPMSGASPDGRVGSDGLVEFKAPNTATHIEWLLGGTVPAKYEHQMIWQMACDGRQWCDFVSYDPRLPEDMRLFIAPRLMRDESRIKVMEREVVAFLAEVDDVVNQLIRTYRHDQAA